MPMELYIHIPFCVKKCAYCDFLSFPSGRQVQREYTDALIREIRRRGSNPGLRERRVDSIFFGGGTPSQLPAGWLCEILSAVRDSFTVTEDAEITIESNPGTLNGKNLTLYREAGINRISIGCQSTENEELTMLGRIHTWEEFLDSFQLAREAGFANINVDLMSGLPGQTLSSWERSLRRIAELKPTHISAYSLILEEGTPLYLNQDQFLFPDEEEERSMYERTFEILKEYGYQQYEISNYSLPGRECLHNLGYWTGVEYLGLGLGAASLMENRRFSNTTDIDRYLRLSDTPEEMEEEEEILSTEERMGERMILGLRLLSGVSAAEFEQEFGQSLTERYGSVIHKYEQWHLLAWEGDRLHLTREGISVSNQIMADFL